MGGYDWLVRFIKKLISTTHTRLFFYISIQKVVFKNDSKIIFLKNLMTLYLRVAIVVN